MPYPIEFGLIFRTPQMIDSLKNIISKETQCALRYDSLNGTLYIDEKGKEAKCKTVHIAGFNDLLKQDGDYCAFRMPDSKAAHCVFLDSANKKYPYEKEWTDKNRIENFYFNEDSEEFNIIFIKQILDKKIKSDAENYYMAKYFYSVQDYIQSRQYLNQIIGKYGFSEEMKSFKKKLDTIN